MNTYKPVKYYLYPEQEAVPIYHDIEILAEDTETAKLILFVSNILYVDLHRKLESIAL